MKKKSMLFIFLLFEFIFCGLVYFLIRAGVVSYSDWKETWPLFAIFSGFALFVTGLFVTRQIKMSYLIPALVLFVFGIFFLLFSMHIIDVPFGQVAARWWYVFAIIAIGILVGVFYALKHFPKKPETESETESE